MPQDYHAYDIRSNGKNELATIESFVKTDYSGTILTKQLIEMGNASCIAIVDIHFLKKTVIGYHLTQIKVSLQELIDVYKSRLESHFERIERVCKFSNNNESTKATSPNYIKEVIIPIFQDVAKYLHRKGIEVNIPDPNTYRIIGKHYRIKVDNKIVGGFSVSYSGDYTLYFTPFNHTTPIGEKIKVTGIEQLCQLILVQLSKTQ